MSEKINKEILEYEETIFWGLTARQFLFSIAAAAVAAAVYFGFRRLLGSETVSWLCVLAAFPFAALGFIKYHGLPAEQFFAAFLRQMATPKKLLFVPVDTEEVLWEEDDPTGQEVIPVDKDAQNTDIG